MNDMLKNRRRRAQAAVDDLTAAQMNAATDAEIVISVVSRFQIQPLAIDVDKVDADHIESEMDVSQHRDRVVLDPSRPCMIKANTITLRIPFTGEPDLFTVRPSTYTLNPPRGRVQRTGDQCGHVLLSMTRPLDEGVEWFNRWIQDQVASIKEYAAASRKDVARFNADLKRQMEEAVARRRAELQQQGQLLANLVVPLRRTSDAPAPIPMPKRLLKPLPSPRAVEQEYTISSDDFLYILNVVRQQTRSFEQTPSAYRKLNEEELRDVILASLNTHFEGDAAGERFRRKGRTDICVEFSNRAAFVGECKVWSGAKVASEALDQLIGYLTWRDCHAALLLFNKTVKGFKALQDDMPALLKAHPRFLRHVDAGHTGEWRAQLRARGDDARLITVHVFLVDLSPDSAAGTA